MKNAFSLAERPTLDQAEAQELIVNAPGDAALRIIGPPGCGKTTALARRAAQLAAGKSVLVVCSHEASAGAFSDILRDIDAAADVRVGTLENHLARWMRAHYLSAGVSPDLQVGDGSAARKCVQTAAAGLLNLSWAMFREGAVGLDVPFLSRPDKFLDEAASLFMLLRRTMTTPEDFETACASGSAAFYGMGIERALGLCRDAALAAGASKRARAALAAPSEVLTRQRQAERELSILLAQLFREYRNALRQFAVWSVEDVIDEGVRWLGGDAATARVIASAFSAVVVDDAEDAEPAVPALLAILRGAGVAGCAIAGCESAALDGIGGRRSALQSDEPMREIVLAPRGPVPRSVAAKRFPNEREEAAWIADHVMELLRSGVHASQIAVLVRSDDAAAVYVSLLQSRGLALGAPSRRFQALDDIEDLLALASVIEDPYDHAHLLRLLACPLVGLSDASLWALCRDPQDTMQLSLDVGARESRKSISPENRRTTLSRNVRDGAVDHLLSETSLAVLQRFRIRLEQWRLDLRGLSAPAAISRLVDDAGYRLRWRQSADHLRARLFDDAARLIEAAAELQAAYPAIGLCDVVRALERGTLKIRPAKTSGETVACEVIADAKGRRWQHAIVAGVARERFPRVYMPRGMAFSRKYGLIVRDNVAGGASQTAKFAWYYTKFKAKSRYLAEERRALQYGLARASGSAVATGFGEAPPWAAAEDLLSQMA